MLPKSIASCSFSRIILVPHYYFQGQKGPIYWAFFQGQKGPIEIFIAHIVHLFIQNLAWSFSRIVLMKCEETYFIETLKVIFKVRIG